MRFQAPFMFFAAVLVLCFNYVVYLKNRSSNVNRSFAIFGLSISFWLFCFGIAYSMPAPGSKLVWFRLGYIGIIFIPINFYTFIYYLQERIKDHFVVILNYIFGVIFLFLNFSDISLVRDLYRYSWGYYPNTFNVTHIFFVTYFMVLFTVSNMLMLKSLVLKKDRLNSIQYQRLKYALLGSAVGSLGALDFIGSYGIGFPPIGFIFMFLYPAIFAFAILKYRFLDVTLVVTRTGIFVLVYSFVLGIPFAVAFGLQERLINIFGNNWWMVPLVSSTVLATGGPFIYLYIQKRAEKRLFEEQIRYQSTLRQASAGMGRIKDLQRLINLIVHIVSRTVRLEHTMLYLDSPNNKSFILSAKRSRRVKFSVKEEITQDSVLVERLTKTQMPIVYEEIKQQTQDYGDLKLARLEKELNELDAAVVVPSFIEERLLAIIVLGEKISKKLYTEDDLAVFSILSNQAALAIENAMFYRDMRETHEQLFKAEKMATIGTMADGLSHQINNRLHALGFIAGDILDTLKLKKDLPMTDEIKEILVDIEHALNRIQENVAQGGDVVRGLLKYTRKGEEGFAEVDLEHLINAAIEMTQFKIKPGEIVILKEFGAGLPKVRGNFTQLQEVFFNLIDNAYDAMKERRAETDDPEYQPTIKISATPQNRSLDIYFEDNGMGIKDEDKNKLFTPFFTTKLSSKKGTGLGLYVVRKLIEENHSGKVTYYSKHKHGTRVHIRLPIFQKTGGSS